MENPHTSKQPEANDSDNEPPFGAFAFLGLEPGFTVEEMSAALRSRRAARHLAVYGIPLDASETERTEGVLAVLRARAGELLGLPADATQEERSAASMNSEQDERIAVLRARIALALTGIETPARQPRQPK